MQKIEKEIVLHFYLSRILRNSKAILLVCPLSTITNREEQLKHGSLVRKALATLSPTLIYSLHYTHLISFVFVFLLDPGHGIIQVKEAVDLFRGSSVNAEVVDLLPSLVLISGRLRIKWDTQCFPGFFSPQRSSIWVARANGGQRTGRWVFYQGSKSVYVKENGKRIWTTILKCISQDGRCLTPYVIFKGKKVQKQWFNEDYREHWYIDATEEGWTSNDIALIWLTKVFIPET